MLVQVYVDDIIFGSTKKELCFAFKKLMHEKFQMSSMGELTFFLGLQVKQKKDGIFISQDKYVAEILKKFGFTKVKTASTPMKTQKPLLKDEDGEEVDVYMYRSMIGSLMYLTSSRPDIMFAVCAYARYQVNPKCKKQIVVANSTTEVEDVAASSCCGQLYLILLGKAKESVKLMMEKLFRMELELMLVTQSQNYQWGSTVTCPSRWQKGNITESTVRRDLQLEDAEGVDCLPNSTIFEQLTLMASKTTAWNEFSSTMASAIICLATNQKFNFSKYIFEGKGFSGRVTPLFPTMVVQNQSELGEGSAIPTDPHHTPTIIQSSTQPQKTQKPRKPKRKDTQFPRNYFKWWSEVPRNHRDAITQTRVLELEKTKTTQQNEIDSLKRRVKRLEKKRSSKTHKLKRLYKVGLTARVESFGDEEDLCEDASKQGRRINTIDVDKDITLVNVQDDVDNEMFDVNVLNDEEVFVAGQNANVVEKVVDAAQVSTAATTVTITTEEITLAQALEALKTSKPKVKGIVFQEPSTTTTITTISSQQSQDKGKGIMIEEPVKPMKKKVQTMLDEEAALKLQAEFDEEERLAREKAEKEKEANIALIEEWDDIQAKIDADHQLAERLQAQEQEELSDAEKATLFQQLLEKRRKHFAAKRAKRKETNHQQKLNRDK
ncbi:uncharacterized mitochondrial protein-like protein [Tanacetum coccineum]